MTFNTNYQAVDTIDVPFHIYLEMEVLFHMAGYNGTLFQTLFDEFYEQVEQINKQNRKPVIFLHYFTETENEINAYFHMAEQIVRRKFTLDPSKQAMVSLVKGCNDAYQIQEKKTIFYNLLAEKHIILDNQEHYYDKGEVKYNIEHQKFFESKEDGGSEEDVARKLRLLNYISIKRGCKNQSILRNIGHILLSSNSLTFKIAFDSEVRDEKAVPLATSLDFLTNRFWLSLNKGLKPDMNLRSFDIITKAQIVMSARVNASIAKLFKELEEEDKAGKFNQQQKLSILARLHSSVANPEDIVSENEDDYLNVISYNDIDQYNAERIIEQEQSQKEKVQLEQIIQGQKTEVNQATTMLNEAARLILVERQNENERNYRKEIETYDNNERLWISNRKSQRNKKSIAITVGYSILIITLYIASIIGFGSPIATIISTICGAIAFVIPFIRPLINHSCIKDSIIYLCFKNEREEYNKQLATEFEKVHPRPQLIESTLEDILSEIQSKIK